MGCEQLVPAVQNSHVDERRQHRLQHVIVIRLDGSQKHLHTLLSSGRGKDRTSPHSCYNGRPRNASHFHAFLSYSKGHAKGHLHKLLSAERGHVKSALPYVLIVQERLQSVRAFPHSDRGRSSPTDRSDAAPAVNREPQRTPSNPKRLTIHCQPKKTDYSLISSIF